MHACSFANGWAGFLTQTLLQSVTAAVTGVDW